MLDKTNFFSKPRSTILGRDESSPRELCAWELECCFGRSDIPSRWPRILGPLPRWQFRLRHRARAFLRQCVSINFGANRWGYTLGPRSLDQGVWPAHLLSNTLNERHPILPRSKNPLNRIKCLLPDFHSGGARQCVLVGVDEAAQHDDEGQ